MKKTRSRKPRDTVPLSLFTVQSNIIQLKLVVGDLELTESYIKLIPEVWLAELSISDLELENSDRSSENSDLLSL
jgi:hypothetical protein